MPAGFMCSRQEVQAKLRNQLCEKGCRCVLQSFSLGYHNSCCSRGAVAVSPGRLRQPAWSPIHSIMIHTTTRDCSVHTEGVRGVRAASTPQPGRQNNHKRRSDGHFSGVSGVSGLKNYPSHVHTGVRSRAHTRNRCAQQTGQPGHPRVLNTEQQSKTLSGVFRCPPPQNGQPGHPGHPQLRWSV